ncbi:hypothetical protein [Rhodococcus oryzae]|uniref:hypothetical protein n=1 Tax=Rhodococcus oryzae TaxID=2571143 RepID=UPI0037BC22BC
MSRSLARRGASILVAAALLGGGLALGGGTASAAEAPDSGSLIGPDSGPLLMWPAVAVLLIGTGTGSIGDDSPWLDCYTIDGPGNRCPESTEQFFGLLLGGGS